MTVTITDVPSKSYVDSADNAIAGAQRVTATFSATGELTTFTGGSRYYVDSPCTIVNIRASVGTAPTGAALKVDVKVNGTSLYSPTSNQPTVAVGTHTVLGGATTITALNTGDFITVDVDQIGSSEAGADLTVQVYLVPAAT